MASIQWLRGFYGARTKKFQILVENSFDMDSLQRSEETLFTLDAFEQNPPNHIVGNAQETASIRIGDSLQP